MTLSALGREGTQRVPHISLVFREMWETRTSDGSLLRPKL
jgi:hypothetical protein